jgi:archaellum component FlaG (FlaF/FlaG flagellin family)
MKTAIKITAYIYLIISTLISCEGIDDGTTAPEDIITIKVMDASGNEITEAISDGETLITLEAQIPANVDDAFKTVTFKNSGGDFVGVGQNTHQVTVNSEGIAQATLKLPFNTSELFLAAEIGGSNNNALYKDEAFLNLASVDNVIALNFLDLMNQPLSTIPRADGTSIIQLQGNVLINQNTLNTIKFNASGGIFQMINQTEVQKSTDTNGSAIVTYIVPQSIGPIFYSAKTIMLEYVSEGTITYERAHADTIILEPTQITMNTMQGNPIIAYLIRNIGKVSIGTDVSFESFQLINGSEVIAGRFTGLASVTSNPQEQVSVVFYADTNDIELTIPVVIRATTTTDTGTQITTEVQITVN